MRGGEVRKTSGATFDKDGAPVGEQRYVSGNNARLIEDLRLDSRERASVALRSHVEAKVAAAMRRGDLPSDTTLILNNAPCPAPNGCEIWLPRILPQGSRLRVYVADGTGATRPYKVYEGTGERTKKS